MYIYRISCKKMNIFNKLLKINPTYENVKDKNNILHLIHVTTHSNFIKLKFGKYRLMENKEHFYKAQRLITILSRFVQKVKRRRFVSRKTEIDCDLRMAPFEPKTAIDLIEQRCIYTFNVYDLINIISTALGCDCGALSMWRWALGTAAHEFPASS